MTPRPWTWIVKGATNTRSITRRRPPHDRHKRMQPTPHPQARLAAHIGSVAAAAYALLKAAWGMGSRIGVRADAATWKAFVDEVGGPLLAAWGTVALALLAAAILQSLVQPWGRRVPLRLRASLAWLGFAVMTPIGLVSLAHTLAGILTSKPFPLLTPLIYIWTYTCFIALGLAFAATAWRTHKPG